MAQRRLFSPDIVESDAFLDMPVSSQALYFHLCMYADDDGFVNPKKIMRLLGSPNDDLKILLAKRFALPFETGVVVVKHWLIHNTIRKDRYKETRYLEEKNQIKVKENGAYTELATIGQPNGNHLVTQVKLSQAKLSKDKEEGIEIQSLRSLFKDKILNPNPEEAEKFLSYWEEKNEGGKKARWQMQKVFDVARRWSTWMANKETKFGSKPREKSVDLSKLSQAELRKLVQ